MTPEEIVVKQGRVGEYLYLISKGDCSINIKDQNGKDHVAYKLVVEGDHFGEISLLFDCPA